MEEKIAQKFGNSSHVVLPKEYIGRRIRFVTEPKTFQDIKSEIINILKPYLENITGVYLYGSYARNEQTIDSDIDVLVITSTKFKIIDKVDSYTIISTTIEGLENTLNNNAVLILPIIKEAKTIINPDLLNKFGKFIDNYAVLKLHGGGYFAPKMFGDVHNKVFNIPQNKTNKLDDKDLNILSLLNNDSRINLVAISEKVKLTPNGVNHRIKNLEKNKTILGYTISLDWKKLDYEWYDIQIKLIKFGEDVDKRLADYFSKHKNIIFYFKYLGGSWDYDLGIIVKNSKELREFINDFRKQFSDIAKISDVFLTLEETTGYKLPEGVFE